MTLIIPSPGPGQRTGLAVKARHGGWAHIPA